MSDKITITDVSADEHSPQRTFCDSCDDVFLSWGYDHTTCDNCVDNPTEEPEPFVQAIQCRKTYLLRFFGCGVEVLSKELQLLIAIFGNWNKNTLSIPRSYLDQPNYQLGAESGLRISVITR